MKIPKSFTFGSVVSVVFPHVSRRNVRLDQHGFSSAARELVRSDELLVDVAGAALLFVWLQIGCNGVLWDR